LVQQEGSCDFRIQKRGRRLYRRQVEAMAAYGIPEDDISRVISVDPKTLRKH
jgi:hypothetical protein